MNEFFDCVLMTGILMGASCLVVFGLFVMRCIFSWTNSLPNEG